MPWCRSSGRSASGGPDPPSAELLPPKLDKWWTVRPGEPPDPVVEEVRAVLRDPALPWLERVSTLAGAREEADDAAAVALSLLLGDREAARRLAEQALVETPKATGFHAWTRARGLIP